MRKRWALLAVALAGVGLSSWLLAVRGERLDGEAPDAEKARPRANRIRREARGEWGPLPTGWLVGRVARPDGESEAHAKLIAWEERSDFRTELSTDENGAFREEVPIGRYSLIAQSPRGLEVTTIVEITAEGSGEILLTLPRALSVRGVVTIDGDPFPEAVVFFAARNHGGNRPTSLTTTSTEGDFDVDVPGVGLYSVSVSGVVGRRDTFQFDGGIRVDDKIRVLDVEISTARVSGRVLDEAGQPIAQARVIGKASAGQMPGGSGDTQSLRDGTYSLRVPPGEVELFVKRRDGHEALGAPCLKVFVTRGENREGCDLSARPPIDPSKRLLLEAYGGQSLDELLAMETTHRIDSLLWAMVEALEAKVARPGAQPLTDEERVILVVESLVRDVFNDGYYGFFVWSSIYVAEAAAALDAIGCHPHADTTRRAVALLAIVGPVTAESVQEAAHEASEEVMEELNRLDEEYYALESTEVWVEDRLFEFVKANHGRIRLR